MAAAEEVYTRGKPGDADNRGESLVQQHLDRMQQQKEAVAMEKLRVLMPQLGDVVRALALSKAEWDIDRAVNMLRSFQVAHLDKINTINKKRKKLREQMEAYDGSTDAEGSGSDPAGDKTGSSSGSGSDTSDSEERKKANARKNSKKPKREKESKSKRKKHRKEKTSKKDRKHKRRRRDESGEDDDKAQRKLTHTEDFGRYGYVGEGDLQSKWSEFQLWATEVRGVNVELLGKAEEKQLWRDYMEDYNTGTLKHKKYYDLTAYERAEAVKASQQRAGGKSDALFDARADEEALRRQKIEERRQQQQDRLNTAYNILKHTDMAKDMREQELLRAEMNLAYKTGDRARAQKLFERLQPDDQKK